MLRRGAAKLRSTFKDAGIPLMTTQLWCLLAGMLLPYVWFFSIVPFRIKQFGRPDLYQPRVQAEHLEGAGARAWE